MTWKPYSIDELTTDIESSKARMSQEQLRLWAMVAVPPEKWALSPWGDRGGGFWVVGRYGRTVIWFNDIEHGFNRSPWTTPGVIDVYWCNQDELEFTMQRLVEQAHGLPLSSPEQSPESDPLEPTG